LALLQGRKNGPSRSALAPKAEGDSTDLWASRVRLSNEAGRRRQSPSVCHHEACDLRRASPHFPFPPPFPPSSLQIPLPPPSLSGLESDMLPLLPARVSCWWCSCCLWSCTRVIASGCVRFTLGSSPALLLGAAEPPSDTRRGPGRTQPWRRRRGSPHVERRGRRHGHRGGDGQGAEPRGG